MICVFKSVYSHWHCFDFSSYCHLFKVYYNEAAVCLYCYEQWKLGSESKGKSWVTENKRKHIEIHIYLFCILSFSPRLRENSFISWYQRRYPSSITVIHYSTEDFCVWRNLALQRTQKSLINAVPPTDFTGCYILLRLGATDSSPFCMIVRTPHKRSIALPSTP